MKRIAAVLVLLSGLGFAQAPKPTTPAPKPTIAELQSEFQVLSAQRDTLLEKLHGITEFQNLQSVEKQMGDIQKEARELQTPTKPADKK